MNIDPMVGLALLGFLGALVFAAFSLRRPPTGGGGATAAGSASVSSIPAIGVGPGRQLIDHIDSLGREAAGRSIEEALGAAHAARVRREIADALASPGPSPGPKG